MVVRTNEDVLRGAGLRVTTQRLAVLDALAEFPHSSVSVVTSTVQDRLGTVSTQTIYDVLEACVGAGLVRRIEPAGSPARFEIRTGDNHHHLVCRACGRTTDVDRAVGARQCLTPSDDAGHEVYEVEVLFWGLCPDCRQEARQGNKELFA
ncbi:MAG: Fur family transcriptional regulator [Jatrophihabitantaceae bacterium]